MAVDEITPSSVWAVGIADGGPNRFAQPLAEYWDGASWSVVPIPAPGTEGFLNALSSSSATDVWAVGFDDSKGSIGGRTLTEHWNGHRWSVVPSPNKGIINNELHGVSVVAGDSAWAVGTRWNGADPSSGGKPLVERWDGHGWSIVTAPAPVPNDSALNAVWAKGGRAWAVGGAQRSSRRSGNTRRTVDRFQVGRRYPQTTRAPVDFEGVAGFRGGAWAVGSWLNSSGASRALIEGWNGESFVVEPTHIPGSESGFQAIWAASATSAWAVGSYTVGRRTYPFIMRCAAPSLVWLSRHASRQERACTDGSGQRHCDRRVDGRSRLLFGPHSMLPERCSKIAVRDSAPRMFPRIGQDDGEGNAIPVFDFDLDGVARGRIDPHV